MLNAKVGFCLLGTLLGLCGVAQAEVVVLKGGQRLSGTLLKNDDQGVVLDLGFDVLRIPQETIEHIETEVSSQATDTPEEVTVNRERLYRTADLPVSSIEANARQFGEAVVMVTSPGGQGSGFMIHEDGYLITNYHVIARETLIKVTVFHESDNGFEQQQYKQVKIVALNPFVDLALLKIEEAERPFKIAYLGDMERIEVGQPVFAIGNPLGLTRTVSQGIVSTTNRNYDGRLYIQTTTDINPGNSGGPLFNLQGEIIGVTSMGYLYMGGLNFAIPVDVVKRFIDNWDAFAYAEDNPNAGFRYLQPSGRKNLQDPPAGQLPLPQ